MCAVSARPAAVRADLNRLRRPSLAENLAKTLEAESWDPATGAVSKIPFTVGKRTFTLKLDLKPYETKLITIQ
jgi:hypothetical protein